MSSSGLTRGSLFCDEIIGSSWGMTQGLGNSRFSFRNSRIPRAKGIKIPPHPQNVKQPTDVKQPADAKQKKLA